MDFESREWRIVFEAAARVANRMLGEQRFVSVQPWFGTVGLFVGDPGNPNGGLVLQPSEMAHHIRVSRVIPGGLGIKNRMQFVGTHHVQEIQ